MNTINGKPVNQITKEEALTYCYENESAFMAECYQGGEDGMSQFGCLIEIIESDTIKPEAIADYGMCDQDLRQFEGEE